MPRTFSNIHLFFLAVFCVLAWSPAVAATPSQTLLEDLLKRSGFTDEKSGSWEPKLLQLLEDEEKAIEPSVRERLWLDVSAHLTDHGTTQSLPYLYRIRESKAEVRKPDRSHRALVMRPLFDFVSTANEAIYTIEFRFGKQLAQAGDQLPKDSTPGMVDAYIGHVIFENEDHCESWSQIAEWSNQQDWYFANALTTSANRGLPLLVTCALVSDDKEARHAAAFVLSRVYPEFVSKDQLTKLEEMGDGDALRQLLAAPRFDGAIETLGWLGDRLDNPELGVECARAMLRWQEAYSEGYFAELLQYSIDHEAIRSVLVAVREMQLDQRRRIIGPFLKRLSDSPYIARYQEVSAKWID